MFDTQRETNTETLRFMTKKEFVHKGSQVRKWENKSQISLTKWGGRRGILGLAGGLKHEERWLEVG